MAEAQGKVDMSALKDTFLECPVCVEHFNQTDRCPRLLVNCLHAFCTQCLQQLLAKEGRGQITCPLCRQVYNVPGKADSLPVDTVRVKLVDFVQMKKEGNVPCTDCPDGNTAESRCQECSVNLCDQCTHVHKRHQLTRDHQIISLSVALQQPLNRLGKRHCCTRHPKHQLEFFCATDDTLCCISCTVLEHKGHDFQKLEDVAKKRQEELESLMQVVHTNTQHLRQRRIREEKRQTAIVQAQRKAKCDVATYFKNMTSILNQRKARLDQDVDQRSQTKLALSKKEVEAIDHTLAIMDSTETYFTQARDKADVVEMLQVYPVIKRSLEASSALKPHQGQGQDQGQIKAREPAVIFCTSNGKLVEKLLSDVGYVIECPDTQEQRNQLLSYFDEVVDAALKHVSRSELIKHLKEKADGTVRTQKYRNLYLSPPIVQKKDYSQFPCNALHLAPVLYLDDTCSICKNTLSVPTKLSCGHTFCAECIRQAFSVKSFCPECGKLHGTVKGNQPKGGTMTKTINRTEMLPGYEDSEGTIVIKYDFPENIYLHSGYVGGDGIAQRIQSPFVRTNIKSSGMLCRGITRTAYLPYSQEGWEVLTLLQKAFDAGLTFSTDESGGITWNISHKTSKTGSTGYPDPGYLDRVKKELIFKGIT